jgi:hypothetical protein
MKIKVVDFVGIVDGSLAIGGIVIGDYSNGPEEVVVVDDDVVVVFVEVVVAVAAVIVIKVKMANCTYSSVS